MVVANVEQNTCGEGSVVNTNPEIKKKKQKKKKKVKLPKEVTNDTDILNDTTVTKCNKINVHLQPVITKDSRHIICPCGNTIAVFRRKTGLLENVFNEHKYDVTNIYINHQDPTQVISCSSSEFLIWDYEDASLSAKKYNISFQAVSWYVNPKCYEDVYFTHTIKNGRSVKLELVKCNLNDANKQIVLGSVSRCVKCVVISKNGEHVIYTYKNKLFIYKNSDDNSDNTSNSFTFDDTQITCVALHPKELVVATGNRTGKIVLWYNLFGNNKQICTKLHWHNLNVADILFTNDGNYLLSGGREGVLVTWQLETQEKSFLPRLGGAIQHLVQSSDEQHVAITLDNNMLKILSTVTSEVTKTIKYLGPADFSTGLSYHSPTECLVLNGRPNGVLQFYHPKDDILKLSIDIIGENRVSDAEGRHVYPTKVKFIAFSQDGTWMATVDVREDRILPTERKLKFWKYSEENKNYSLNTLVDPPHKDTINSLSFRPIVESADNEEMVVTTSNDGDIKTWVMEKETDTTGAVAESWQIQSISNYGENSCRHACFSQDGSILAVLFSAVTLWDTEDLTFKKCLPYNAKGDRIKHMAFGFEESSHYLIGHSTNYLVVWDVKDLTTCSILWMLEANVCLLACDPFSKFCAVFIKPEGNQTNLYLFDPASPSPATSCDNVTKGYGKISSALFTKKSCKSSNGESVWDQTGHLYILTGNTEILVVEGKEEVKGTERGNNVAQDSDEKSGYENLFGNIVQNEELSSDEEDDVVNTDGERHISSGKRTAAFIRKLMSTPTQALPSADIMCMAYMKTLLTPRKDVRDEESTAMETEEKEERDEADKPVDSPEEVPMEETTSNGVSKDDDDIYQPSEELIKQLKTLDFSFVANAFK